MNKTLLSFYQKKCCFNTTTLTLVVTKPTKVTIDKLDFMMIEHPSYPPDLA